MAYDKFYLGSHGPYLVDPEAAINDPDDDFSGVTQHALTTEGGIAVGYLDLLDTNQSNVLSLVWNENDDTDRTLNILIAGGDRSLTLNENLTISDGYNVVLAAAGQANTFTMNESFTIGDGYAGTITFSAESKTLTVEDVSIINQDLSTDSATAQLAALTLTTSLTVNNPATTTNLRLGTFLSALDEDAEYNYITIGKENATGNALVVGYRYDTTAEDKGGFISVYGDAVGTGLFIRKVDMQDFKRLTLPILLM